MDSLKTILVPLGRLLMSSIFIWAGINKLTNPGGTGQYFASLHLPAPEVLVWVVIFIEVVGGLAILVGFLTRWAAIVLAIFCLVTGFAVHLPVGDTANMINFYKNLVMAGGFLYVFAYGAGALSLDKAMGIDKV